LTDPRPPKLHVAHKGDFNNPIDRALASMMAEEGTANDWRNSINVPRPIMWDERPELIGKIVVPHTCHGKTHNPKSEGCICDLIGKPVKIVAIYDTPFVGTPSYHIEGSAKRVQEPEFSPVTREGDPDYLEGYVLENADGKFLAASHAWLNRKDRSEGYVIDKKTVRAMLDMVWPNGRPTMAHPANQPYTGGSIDFTGDPVPFDNLRPQLTDLFDILPTAE
jgi:hypothetical protein